MPLQCVTATVTMASNNDRKHMSHCARTANTTERQSKVVNTKWAILTSRLQHAPTAAPQPCASAQLFSYIALHSFDQQRFLRQFYRTASHPCTASVALAAILAPTLLLLLLCIPDQDDEDAHKHADEVHQQVQCVAHLVHFPSGGTLHNQLCTSKNVHTEVA